MSSLTKPQQSKSPRRWSFRLKVMLSSALSWMSSLLTRKPSKEMLLLEQLTVRLEELQQSHLLVRQELQQIPAMMEEIRRRMVLVEELQLETASSLRPPPETVIAEKLGLPPQRFRPTGQLPPPTSHPASQS